MSRKSMQMKEIKHLYETLEKEELQLQETHQCLPGAGNQAGLTIKRQKGNAIDDEIVLVMAEVISL